MEGLARCIAGIAEDEKLRRELDASQRVAGENLLAVGIDTRPDAAIALIPEALGIGAWPVTAAPVIAIAPDLIVERAGRAEVAARHDKLLTVWAEEDAVVLDVRLNQHENVVVSPGIATP